MFFLSLECLTVTSVMAYGYKLPYDTYYQCHTFPPFTSPSAVSFPFSFPFTLSGSYLCCLVVIWLAVWQEFDMVSRLCKSRVECLC